ncbi:MAG: hypothetical protein WC592_08425 [Candidatus Omnitrophota bacterium]|nr:hypothetical protein [Candidatus Omnitrophota bacterium]
MSEKAEVVDGKKKASGSVTFFAWTFIIVNFIGLITSPGMHQNYSFLAKNTLTWMVLYAVLTSLAGIVAGIFLLFLKEWARKTAITLVLIGVLGMIVFVPFNHRYASIAAHEPKSIAVYEKQYDKLPPETLAKIQMPREEFISRMATAGEKVIRVMTGVFEVVTALYLFLLFWFFTKTNVRKQFS